MCVTECDAHHDEFSRHTSHPLFRSFDSTGSALILVFHPAVYFLTTGRREILNRHGPALVSNNKTVPDFIFIFFYDRPSSCVMARIDSTIRPPAVGIQTDGFTSVQCRRGTRFKNDRYKEKQLILISPNLSIFFLLRLIIWIGSDKQDRRVLPFFQFTFR